MNEETKTDDDIYELDGGSAASNPATELEDGGDPFAALHSEIEDLRQKLLYAQAETQNVRRRMEKEKTDAQAYAATGFARDILSVADNMSRALAALPEHLREDEKVKPLVTGIEMTARELDNVFQRNGISRIETKGAKLDPNRHQAMMEIASDEEPGTIVQELQPGYMIRDRLLRPALVGVAKAG